MYCEIYFFQVFTLLQLLNGIIRNCSDLENAFLKDNTWLYCFHLILENKTFHGIYDPLKSVYSYLRSSLDFPNFLLRDKSYLVRSSILDLFPFWIFFFKSERIFAASFLFFLFFFLNPMPFCKSCCSCILLDASLRIWLIFLFEVHHNKFMKEKKS